MIQFTQRTKYLLYYKKIKNKMQQKKWDIPARATRNALSSVNMPLAK